MSERTIIAIKLILTHIVLMPVLLFVSFILNRDAFLSISIIQTILVILYFSGYWEFFGFRFRVGYSILIEFALLFELIRRMMFKSSNDINLYLVLPFALVQFYLLYELVKIIITIYKKEEEVFEIGFPFKNGKYLITDGGNSRFSRLMNYHYYSRVHKKNRTYNSMLFATDIVKFGDSGKRFLPKSNEEYPIFGENLFSPIGGAVVRVVNNIDDNTPYCGNYPYNTGNTIVIKADNRFLLMGHLKKGGVRVSVGDIVNAGDLIAEAGNSGYSERPHLHMQLIESAVEDFWKGTGLSIQFGKKNLFKNRLISI